MCNANSYQGTVLSPRAHEGLKKVMSDLTRCLQRILQLQLLFRRATARDRAPIICKRSREQIGITFAEGRRDTRKADPVPQSQCERLLLSLKPLLLSTNMNNTIPASASKVCSSGSVANDKEDWQWRWVWLVGGGLGLLTALLLQKARDRDDTVLASVLIDNPPTLNINTAYNPLLVSSRFLFVEYVSQTHVGSPSSGFRTSYALRRSFSCLRLFSYFRLWPSSLLAVVCGVRAQKAD